MRLAKCLVIMVSAVTIVAVRMGDWKGMCLPFGGELQLFDLCDDLGEQKNVAEGHPDVVKRMREAMKQAHTPSPQWKLPGKASAS